MQISTNILSTTPAIVKCFRVLVVSNIRIRIFSFKKYFWPLFFILEKPWQEVKTACFPTLWHHLFEVHVFQESLWRRTGLWPLKGWRKMMRVCTSVWPKTQRDSQKRALSSPCSVSRTQNTADLIKPNH